MPSRTWISWPTARASSSWMAGTARSTNGRAPRMRAMLRATADERTPRAQGDARRAHARDARCRSRLRGGCRAQGAARPRPGPAGVSRERRGSARTGRGSRGADRLVEPLTDAAESAVAIRKPVEEPPAGAPAGSRARKRALARHVGRAARPGTRALPALSVAAARAAPRAAQPVGEVPVAAARGAGEGAGEFSQVQAAAAGAAPDAARAM